MMIDDIKITDENKEAVLSEIDLVISEVTELLEVVKKDEAGLSSLGAL